MLASPETYCAFIHLQGAAAHDLIIVHQCEQSTLFPLYSPCQSAGVIPLLLAYYAM